MRLHTASAVQAARMRLARRLRGFEPSD